MKFQLSLKKITIIATNDLKIGSRSELDVRNQYLATMKDMANQWELYSVETFSLSTLKKQI
jgi:hypothetical protein